MVQQLKQCQNQLQCISLANSTSAALLKMKCSKLLSSRQFIREFHYSRFWYTHNDWRAFVYIPWFPYKWPYQIIHLIYRWIIASYFIAWLVVSGIATGGPVWFVYLTHWGMLVFVFYLVVAALSVTAKFFSVHVWSKCGKSDEPDLSRERDYLFNKPTGCCGYGSNQLSWYQMIHWACFNIGAEAALAVLLLYWTAVYGGWPIDGVSANQHIVNGLISIVDVWFTGIPVSILHFVYPIIFSATYTVFTGVYFVSNGTNFEGDPYVYPVLDYGTRLESATATVVCVSLIFVPLLHLVFYAMYVARFWLVYAIYGRSRVPCVGYKADPTDSEDSEKIEMA